MYLVIPELCRTSSLDYYLVFLGIRYLFLLTNNLPTKCVELPTKYQRIRCWIDLFDLNPASNHCNSDSLVLNFTGTLSNGSVGGVGVPFPERGSKRERVMINCLRNENKTGDAFTSLPLTAHYNDIKR